MDLGLKNKIIIVTGGAKGIGEGIVKVLGLESILIGHARSPVGAIVGEG